jgi:predicted Zn-dependent protease
MFAYGNSKGVKRSTFMNYVEFSVLVSHESGGSGYSEQFSNYPEELDIVGAFKLAYDKAIMNQNPVEVQPGPYTVVLEPLAVAEMIMYLSFCGFSGKSVQDRYSFLTGKLGEKLFDEKVTIVDDCTDPHTMRLPFDFEGLPRQKVAIVENGVAKAVVYDQMSALKDGVPSTGHSVNSPGNGGIPLNLVMANGDQSLEELIASTDNGLLITRFHYMNIVNPRQASLTALTRDGVFKIENGKVMGAVKNMRFTETMLDALKEVAGISKERQRCKAMFGNYYVPCLKLENFHFTGKTDA